MISFEGGPADGNRLSLRRTPVYLRVVIDSHGVVDALDQLDDEVRLGETVHVYRLLDDVGTAIVCSRGKSGGCRHERIARYGYCEDQPPEEVCRANSLLREWAEAKHEDLRPKT